MALTKAMLTDTLTDCIGFNKRESKDVVESFFNQLNDTLTAGEEIKLAGFGKFSIKDKSERTGRNPKTGEVVALPAKHKVHFKPGKELKGRVDNSANRVSVN